MTFLLLLVLSAWGQDEHAIVVSREVDNVELSKREVKQFFTRQKMTWGEERDVTVVLPLLESPAMTWLARQVLGLPPDVYHRYLLEKAYRAGEQPPEFVAKPQFVEGEVVLTVMRKDNYSEEQFAIVHIR